jgi:hypothetical protein
LGILAAWLFPPEIALLIIVADDEDLVAASLLERLGLSVLNVAGGTTSWMEAGLPLAQPDV